MPAALPFILLVAKGVLVCEAAEVVMLVPAPNVMPTSGLLVLVLVTAAEVESDPALAVLVPFALLALLADPAAAVADATALSIVLSSTAAVPRPLYVCKYASTLVGKARNQLGLWPAANSLSNDAAKLGSCTSLERKPGGAAVSRADSTGAVGSAATSSLASGAMESSSAGFVGRGTAARDALVWTWSVCE